MEVLDDRRPPPRALTNLRGLNCHPVLLLDLCRPFLTCLSCACLPSQATPVWGRCEPGQRGAAGDRGGGLRGLPIMGVFSNDQRSSVASDCQVTRGHHAAQHNCAGNNVAKQEYVKCIMGAEQGEM